MSSAIAETMIAMNSDSSVMGRSYATGTGRWKASIPMKCIDQMPLPMDTAPAISQVLDFLGLDVLALTQPARSSAVYEAMVAIRMESATKLES